MSSHHSTCRGITISVTAETNAGGRRHMEDYIAVNLAPSEESFNEVGYLREQAYVGVFDGHGGKEAAKCARERLWEIIQKQPKFRSSDLTCVTESIREGFVALHKEMEPQREQWKKNKMGDLSTAGTTASTVIFRQDHIIVANVGDSTAVLAVSNPQAGQEGQHPVLAKTLTIDHKPEDPNEIARIEKQGGKVMMSRKGVPRVVWQRERKVLKVDGSPPDSTNPAIFDAIPFLSVARSLGDFWSFNPTTNEFVVSPSPDVHVLPLKPKEQKFLVVASDGLWNVMTPTQVVQFIWDYENDDQTCHQPRDVVKAVINEALRRWKHKNLLADNISVLIAFLAEEEVVVKVPNSTSPVVASKEVATTSDPSPHSNTILPRENLLPTPTTSKPIIEVNTKTKLRHRKRARKAVSPPSLGSTDPVSESTRRRRKRTKAEDCVTSPAKKSKMELTDSGLEVDSQSEPVGTERSVTEDGSQPGDPVKEESVVCPAEEPMVEGVPSKSVGDDEDSSSGVSSDNSEPEGMIQHADMCSTPLVECA